QRDRRNRAACVNWDQLFWRANRQQCAERPHVAKNRCDCSARNNRFCSWPSCNCGTQSGGLLGESASFGLLRSIGTAMVPVAFAYGGWQTATFVAGEMRDARRNLSHGLLIGVGGVVALYLAVNLACLRVLGSAGLDATTTPASDVMHIALGERGAQWIALAI